MLLFSVPPQLILGLIFVVILILVLLFIWLFVANGFIRHGRLLKRVENKLKEISSPTSLNEIGNIFRENRHLFHLWNEFEETLHKQYEERNGERHTSIIRSTVPAEAYFNNESIVDNRLYTEFFKHLPGIFTGLGIIGTFTGLISGLGKFEVTDNAITVRTSLSSLMDAVSEAFIVSAIAISLAIIFTILEKAFLARLYSLAEKLTHTLDNKFKAGAGEEYLARLVKASEESASQTKILKDSLVNDLRVLMNEVASRQIEGINNVSKENYNALSKSIDDLANPIITGIKGGLKEPLEDIKDAVKKASGDQTKAATDKLEEVMRIFSEAFGDRISDLQKQNGEIAKDMRSVSGELKTLVEDLKTINKKSTEELVDKIGTVNNEMATRNKEMVGQMTGSVDSVAKELAKASTNLTDSVITLNSLTDKMNPAADNFAKTGDSLSRLLNQINILSTQITQTSESFKASAANVQSASENYQNHQNKTVSMLDEFNSIVENARNNAGLSQDLVRSLEESAKKLKAAQESASGYLGGVNDVLKESMESFAENFINTVKNANDEFNESMTKAIQLIKSAIEQLDDTIVEFTSMSTATRG